MHTDLTSDARYVLIMILFARVVLIFPPVFIPVAVVAVRVLILGFVCALNDSARPSVTKKTCMRNDARLGDGSTARAALGRSLFLWRRL